MRYDVTTVPDAYAGALGRGHSVVGERRGITMTGRKCGACKHFEPAPIWRKGWCRNPLLYSPQQSHLVFEDDLDCERGMGNYWEPVEQAGFVDSSFSETVSRAFTGTPSRTPGGQPVFTVSGSSGYGSDPPPPSGGPPIWGSGGSGRGSGDGGDYFGGGYEEERYWTDYLRIAAPVLGVFLLIVLFWFWVSNFLGDDDDPNQGANGTATTNLPTTQITATATGAAAAGTGTTPIATAGVTGTASAGDDPTPTSEVVPPGGEIYAGATVEVANTGGAGVNVRADANTSSEVVTVALDGWVGVTTDVAIEGEGYIWWPVDFDGTFGYVVQDYLILIE